MVWNSLSMFILYFYTDVMGMKAAIISTLMLVVRIIAGFMDIASGIVVDKTKTKYGKRNTAILGSIIFILGSLFALIDLTSVKLIYISIIVKGTGNALISATVFALLADTIEYGEWKTNVRTEGLVYSAGNFGLKIGIGLGTAIVGWLLAFSNYNGSSKIQTNTAINAINILFIWLPMILSGVQIILLKFYKLDKIYPNIISDLENRKI
ncbi:MFS transporter [Clostridium botulinum]|nr:MFS transporter [Clostridium botulinum]